LIYFLEKKEQFEYRIVVLNKLPIANLFLIEKIDEQIKVLIGSSNK